MSYRRLRIPIAAWIFSLCLWALILYGLVRSVVMLFRYVVGW